MPNTKPEESDSPSWTVWRIDDNGNRFEVARHLTQAEAESLVEEFTRRGHKQLYWSERDHIQPSTGC